MMRLMRTGSELLAALRPNPVLDALAGEPGVHVVGGAVRDALLDRAPHELDLLVEGDATAVARHVAERLGGDVIVHDRFGTATVRTPAATFDLVSARTERYPEPGALPEVRPGATAEEDLARRDVSVNAIALRLADGALIAWPGALEDLQAGRLRVLHDRSFIDDPTRLLRVARYAGRLGFAVEPHTDALVAAAVRDGALGTVSGTRLGEELRRLAAEPQPPALAALERQGLGAALLPAFVVDDALVTRAQALTPPGGRADLAALAATVRGARRDELAAALDRLAFSAPERELVLAAAGAPALRDGRGDELYAAARRLPPEAVAVAGAAGDEAAAHRWLDDLRHRRLDITGDDVVAAGLQGPAVGAALERATRALMRGDAGDRASQLAVALGSSG
jgi:tRNA nucleotidyltransferase (CCA-adding enzyme)